MKYCNVVGHGGSARSMKPGEVPSLWTCNHSTCGGIQAWRAHMEETLRDLLREEHRWQTHYSLPLTPLPWVRA